jgi:two-component system, chemotaxis family, chemotaxis protein CheY
MTAAHSILLVEDDRDIRDSLLDALAEAGYEVHGAVDGLDALDKLRGTATPPNLILLDLMMPRMNGSEFRKAVLEEDRWKDIPVLLLTADAQARAKAEELAVTGYLRKPVKLSDLFRAVANAIAR